MIFNLYAIVDIKANAIVACFNSPSDESACRSFEDMIFRPEDNVFNQHPEDFKLISGLSLTVNEIGNVVNHCFPSDLRFGSEYSRALIDSKRIQMAEFLHKLESVKRGDVDNG